MAKSLHRIKAVLEEKGKTGYWLAKESGIAYNSVNRYLNGKIDPSLSTLFKIAKVLKVNPKELINA